MKPFAKIKSAPTGLTPRLKTSIISLHGLRFFLILSLSGIQAFAASATWNLNPTGNWNTAANWTPNTVPNAAADIATFGVSNTTAVSNSVNIEVDRIVFNAGASAYTLTVGNNFELTLSGSGIVNNSGVTQRILNPTGALASVGLLRFTNSATAGTNTIITNQGASVTPASFGGRTFFMNNSTAGSAVINNQGATVQGFGGFTVFMDNSKAGNAVITNNGGTVFTGYGGQTRFSGTSSAENAVITNNASIGTVSGAWAETTFSDTSTAANATLIANDGGTFDGGGIIFQDASTGGTPRIEVYGNGFLSVQLTGASSLTIGSLAGTGMVYLDGDNLTIGSNNLSTTFTGTIDDFGSGGSLTKIGTGTFTLGGNQLYIGNTEIQAGTLNLAAANLASAQVNVASGATLQGSGTLAGTLINAGSVNPTGTLNVGGDFQNLSNGILIIDITSQSIFDVLAATGNAILDGTLRVVVAPGFRPSLGSRFTILTAAAGVIGTFSQVQQAGYFAVEYNADDVTLVTTNSPAAGSAGSAVTLSAAEEEFLAQIIEPTFIQFKQLILANANVLYQTVKERSVGLRAGQRGFVTYGMGDLALIGEGKGTVTSDQPDPFRVSADNRWAGWVSGQGTFAQVSSLGSLPSYHYQTGAITSGIDYRPFENAVIGGYAGYQSTYSRFTGGSKLNADGARFGLYSNYNLGGFWLAGLVGGGADSYTVFRDTGTGSSVRSDPNGYLIQSALNSGYDWRLGNWTLGANGGMQYTWLSVDSYTENGGSIFASKVGQQNVSSLRSTLGGTITYTQKLNESWALIPSAGAAWQFEFLDQSQNIPVTLGQGAGPTVFVPVDAGSRNTLLASAALGLNYRNRATVSVGYLLQSSGDVLSQSLVAQAGVSF